MSSLDSSIVGGKYRLSKAILCSPFENSCVYRPDYVVKCNPLLVYLNVASVCKTYNRQLDRVEFTTVTEN